jgi:uracil-DNA glycosylase family 4
MITRDDTRRARLDELSHEIHACRRCPLWENTHQAVPGEGNPSATVFFIGEAPGEKEDLTGRPFVGRAGSRLTALITGAGLSREEVFIGNIVKHRPPGNRDPRSDEIAVCSPWLDRQIQVIRPRILVPLGRHSSRYILSKTGIVFEKITDIRGTIVPAELWQIPVLIVPTLHPAAALYSPRYRKDLEEDFMTIKKLQEQYSVEGLSSG